MSESRFCHIAPTGKLVRIASLDEALAAVKNEGFLWLDYCQPTKEALSALMVPFGVHSLSIEDCLDENQVPKMEDFPQNTFLLFNAFIYADKKILVDEVDLIIGPNYLISVSGYNAEGRRPLSGVESVVERDMDNARQGPAFLMHVILDHIVDCKFVAIEALEEELDALEEAMLADPSSFNPAGLLHLRRNLLALRKSLFHEREILVKICRRDCPFIPEKAIYHYRDIYDHLAKFFELTETYRDIVTSLMELHVSMLSNVMASTANRTNLTVRRLTFITTIFMPLTLLAGIGGMSEWTMMTGPENWKIAYPIFMAAMALIGLASYYFFRWLEKRS
ncbi:MAG: magnesium transporter CorA family protein [Candidatus Sumerlaeota bacterium]|nr:magnesium transporter CorA family protein [Candidatus Sumerlaeota bacterium]